MKSSIFLLSGAITLFATLILTAQNNITYFNKTFGGTDTINILAQAIQPVEDGYIVLGGYTVSEYRALYLKKIDLMGNELWLKTFETSSPGDFYNLGIVEWGGNVLKDGNLVVVTYKKQEDICVNKIDENGTSFFFNKYEMEARQTPKQIIKTPDNGYIIAGMEGVVTNDTVKAYALKIDSMGNYEWDKRYVMGNDARFFSVQHTPWDGGYIFGGMGYSTTTGYDMFVVKTTANGDTLWTKRYGNEFSNCAALVIPFISYDEYLNGAEVEYIMTSCWHDSSNPWQSKNYIAKINSIGNIVWEKKHTNYAPFASLQTFPYITPDKHIVGAAAYYQSGNWLPVVISYNSNGTIEWSKPFTINSQKDCYLKDLQPTPDGGYVLAGYQYSSPQTAWVLKIDSLGKTCSYVGCDSTVVVEVFPAVPPLFEGWQGGELQIYPVPATTHLYIRYQIPAGGAVWRLYNLTGTQVAQAPLWGGAGTATADVSHLPAGMYFYRVQLLSSGQTVAGGKIMVE